MNEEKRYYDVSVEAIVPITIRYRVFAKDEEEALSMVERSPLTNISGPPKYTLSRLIRKAARVYKMGTSLLIKTKNY